MATNDTKILFDGNLSNNGGIAGAVQDGAQVNIYNQQIINQNITNPAAPRPNAHSIQQSDTNQVDAAEEVLADWQAELLRIGLPRRYFDIFEHEGFHDISLFPKITSADLKDMRVGKGYIYKWEQYMGLQKIKKERERKYARLSESQRKANNDSFLKAAEAGDEATIDELLNKGVNINAKHQEHGYTALMMAASKPHVTVVEKLILAGADVNDKDNNGETALMQAASNGQDTVVEKLVSAGADVNDKAEFGFTALILATCNGHDTVVEKLILAGADVNDKIKDGRTALMAAVWCGHDTVVEKLVSAGADVNDKPEDGKTALMAAAWRGHDIVVEKLVSAGADVNYKNKDGRTALMTAAKNGQDTVVEKLVSAGADVNDKDKREFTALMDAASNGQGAVVEKLILAGASLVLRNNDGKTALNLAEMKEHHTTVKLLADALKSR